jgi:cell division transport system permease protein
MAPRIEYYLKESFQGMRRNALIAFAAVSTAFIALFLLGLALLVQRQANLLINFANADVQISIFLRDDINAAQQEHLQELLIGMPEVKNLHYESKQDAYLNFQRIFRDQPDLVENVSPDAIPASFRVDLHQPEQFEVIRARVEAQPGIDQIVDHREFLERLNAVTAVFRLGVMAVAILMLIAAAALIGNTVRMAVFARRKEIGIMRLVGATNWFIRLPFMIEGIVAALIGAGAAVLALFIMKVAFLDPLRTKVAFLPWVGSADVMATIPWLLTAGVAVAVVAGLLALGRYLEV